MTRFLLPISALIFASQPVYGYIDPGTGSVLLQWLIALVVGGWLTFRVFAGNLWQKLRGKKSDDSESAGTPAAPADDEPRDDAAG